ncbi:hypothetical protein CU097_015833 [Rhizopus azygosporus]|uniref:DUF7721 domain-containing protein n=1 Tax=Rhizopus azygosporus TaxID=86630 RepID=A0A367KFF9_RHIAZ|nr:hypothetical protein CU097_015833 [Rhizopus azygosporus]
MAYGEADSYQGGQDFYPKPDVSQVSRLAKQHAQYDDDDDDENGVFSQALHNVIGRDDAKKELDEDTANHAANAHNQIYNENNGQPAQEHSSRDLGSAAAMQAFKMFSGGGSSGGGSGELIAMAMGEAQKLFKSQGQGGGGANQAEMLQTAAMVAMQLLMTQQKGSSGGGGGNLGAVMGVLQSLGGGGGKKQESGGVSGTISNVLGGLF